MNTIRKQIVEALNRWLGLVSIIAIICCSLSYLGRYSFYFDILSNFKIQYFVAIVFSLFFFLFQRKKVFIFLNSFFVCVLLFDLAPWYRYSGSYDGEKEIKVYYSNVLTTNENYDLVLSQIRKLAPDIIVFLEINSKWAEAIQPIKKKYKYHKIIPQSDNFGIALLSRHVLEDVEIKHFSRVRVPSIYSKLVIENKNIHLIVTHPLPPGSIQNFISRNGALKSTGKFINTLSGKKVIIGDLNTTMWSPYYKDLIESTDLYDCRRGFGLQPTWPSSQFITMIPLDHCLVSKDIQVYHFEVLSDIGSDHLPFLVNLGI